MLEENGVTPDPSKSEEKKKKAADGGLKKLRLTLAEQDHSPLNHFQNQLKSRGVKNYDISTIVSEALHEVAEEWWENKLEQLTPIEFKLQAALENPEMREKIMSVLKDVSPSSQAPA